MCNNQYPNPEYEKLLKTVLSQIEAIMTITKNDE
jgi:hypothetical protein